MIDLFNALPEYRNNSYFITHIIAIAISYIAFFITFCASIVYLLQDHNLKTKHLGSMFSRLPGLSMLDKIIYKSIGFGFPILTIAIGSGFLLGKDIVGSYWEWNPRGVYSVAIWLLFAVILHVRLSSKLRGKKIALLSIFAFLIIIVSFFASCGVIK